MRKLVSAALILLITAVIFLAGRSKIMAQIPTPTSSVNYSQDQGTNLIIELLEALFKLLGPNTSNPSVSPTPSITNPPLLTASPSAAISPPIINNNFIYYYQCDSQYGYLSLPDGCNLCESGCGPTTVAMILSSKVNSSYTPHKIIDLYNQSNLYLGCVGSGYYSAQKILRQEGLFVSNLIFANNTPLPIEYVADEMRKWIAGGSTLFTLAVFRTKSGAEVGHYFWVTEVDENKNVWAYDPYYGRFQIPFNENVYYPYPKYILAFAVR